MQRKKNSWGFTLVELVVVIVILAVLIGVSIGGVYSWVNQARINTDINDAKVMEDTMNTLSTNEYVVEWAKQSNESHIITWSHVVDGLSTHGFNEEYLVSGCSWSYLIKSITLDSIYTDNGYYEDDEDKYSCVPYSKTGKGFIILCTRDGNGNASFKCYAVCTLTNSDIDNIISQYNLSAKESAWIRGKGNDA